MAKSARNNFFDINVPDIALRSLFFKYDKDENGLLDEKELRELLMNDLGLTIDQAQVYYMLLDKDGDSRISFNEFSSWIRSKENFQSVTGANQFYYLTKAINLFQQYDKDESNSLDQLEFKLLLSNVGGSCENLEQLIASLDVDHNGRISFQEFLKWLNWIPVHEVFTPKS